MATSALAIDTETHRIQPGLLAPPLVCGSAAWLEPGPRVAGALLAKGDALGTLARALDEPAAIIVGANIAFDLLVFANECARRGIDAMPGIFRALEDGRVFDLQLAEALHAIAHGHLNRDPRTGMPLKNLETGKRGSYSLANCVDLVLGRQDAKANDDWRQRYAELEYVPMDQWPVEARDYPVDDARNTLEVALAQCGVLPRFSVDHEWKNVTLPDGRAAIQCVDCGTNRFSVPCSARRPSKNLHTVAEQTASAFALHAGAAWGFRVDQSKVDIIERHALERRKNLIGPFIQAGVVTIDAIGEFHENRSILKRLVATAYGASGSCSICRGTGKVPSPKSKTLQCPDCKGRSAPWKAAGTVRAPTVASCARCANTGRVAHPRPDMINCVGADDVITCDGTGIVLTEDVPRSKKDGISYGRDTLIESGDEFLMSYGHYQEDAKVLKDYVPYLREARVQNPATGTWSDVTMTLRPNPILATGRVSYRGYIQLFPRAPGYIDRETHEYIPSLRECFVPRPGCLFSSQDFKAGELVTHAQSCIWLLGFSDLAKALLKKVDPHSQLAATTLGIALDQFSKKDKRHADARTGAKWFNFGRPAGAGAPKIVMTQRKQGADTPCPNGPTMIEFGGKMVPGYKGLRYCILMDGADRCGVRKTTVWGRRQMRIPPTCVHCLECGERLNKYWLGQWGENEPYFKLIAGIVEDGMVISEESLARWPHLREVYRPGQRLDPAQIMQHVTGRLRRASKDDEEKSPFCSLANSFFQGLLSDISKHAHRICTRECYDSTIRVPDMLFENSIRSAYAGGMSPLLGSRIPVFQHDELIGEHPESIAAEAATRISEVMRDVMRWYCPDLADAAEAEPTLMPAWLKQAERVVHRGRLVPWMPGHDPKKCAECAAA